MDKKGNQKTDPELQKLLDETAKAEAELEKLVAEKALEDARNPKPPSPTQAAKDQAEADKAAADARKAAAEASKAETDAATAAAKSLIGEMPESPFTGEVELKEGAGAIESEALAARALTQAAERIARHLKDKGETTLKNAVLYIFQADEMPKLDEAVAFDSQLTILQEALGAAITKSEQLMPSKPPAGRREFASFIAPAIEAAVKLLGLLRTDYSIGGVQISGYDQALLFEVARALLRDANGTPAAIHIPSLLFPEKVICDAERDFVDRLKTVTRDVTRARRYQKLHASQAETLAQEAAKQADADKKKDLQEQAEDHKKAAEELDDAVQMYDAMLGASDATSAMRLATLIKAQGLRRALRAGIEGDNQKDNQKSCVLALKVFKSGGTYYTRKGFWEFFRLRIPVFLSGGVVCGFSLFDGDGKVVASGSLPAHSPFVSLSDFGKSSDTGKEPWYEAQEHSKPGDANQAPKTEHGKAASTTTPPPA